MSFKHIVKLALCHVLVPAIGLCVIARHVRSQASNQGTVTSACLPTFPYKEGWLGGDAGYSIALAPGKSLWLFGDSFVRKAPGPTRSGSKFVRNAIAISTCDEEHGWQINYYWRGHGKQAARAFFETNTKKYWYWPLDGFLYQNQLYVAIAKLEDNPTEKIFFFFFQPSFSPKSPTFRRRQINGGSSILS